MRNMKLLVARLSNIECQMACSTWQTISVLIVYIDEINAERNAVAFLLDFFSLKRTK